AGADTEVQKDTGRESGGRRAAAVVVDVSAPSAASEPATGCVAGPLASSAADAAPPTVQWTDLETAAVNRDADDEGLLATLDEETAKAIRVMRRLMLNRKSVRELLAEYQSKKSGTAAKVSTKKSWWHRGK
ncbi:MAG: hypothetical protein HY718_10805, partial [Planctomycetes bacterium]|nr:hypothetical protein [Planctomycetota bacterium]